jgi:hypothetical protein
MMSPDCLLWHFGVSAPSSWVSFSLRASSPDVPSVSTAKGQNKYWDGSSEYRFPIFLPLLLESDPRCTGNFALGKSVRAQWMYNVRYNECTMKLKSCINCIKPGVFPTCWVLRESSIWCSLSVGEIPLVLCSVQWRESKSFMSILSLSLNCEVDHWG